MYEKVLSKFNELLHYEFKIDNHNLFDETLKMVSILLCISETECLKCINKFNTIDYISIKDILIWIIVTKLNLNKRELKELRELTNIMDYVSHIEAVKLKNLADNLLR